MSIPNASDSSTIKPLLRRGEEILWTGRPRRLTYARHRGSVIFLFLFGAIFTTVGTLAVVSVLSGSRAESSSGEEIGFVGSLIFALLFPTVGLLVLTYVAYTWKLAGRLVYAVTNERLLAVDARLHGGKVADEWGLEVLPFLEVKQGRSGSGNVLFAYCGGDSSNQVRHTGFIGISEPRAVASVIREQRYAPGKPESWLDDVDPTQKKAGSGVNHATLLINVPSEVRDLLQEGEDVVWLGKPILRRMLLQGTLPLLFFFCLWYGVTIGLWVVPRVSHAMAHGKSGVAPVNWFEYVFMIPFLFAPLVLVGFELRRRLRLSRDGHYVVTTRRAIVLDPGASLSAIRLVEFGPSSASQITVKDHGTWGHIFFGTPKGGQKYRKQNLIYGFTGVEHPRRVADIIKAQSWVSGATWK